MCRELANQSGRCLCHAGEAGGASSAAAGGAGQSSSRVVKLAKMMEGSQAVPF